MANVKLLQYDGSEKIYAGVRKVALGTPNGDIALYSEGLAMEGVQITPDFSRGDMAVEAPAGTLVKTAIVKKPENLIPGNIRKGETVAGVTGELIGDTEELMVALNFISEEDSQVVSEMVINPSAEGKVISRVTVRKPDTLLPENISTGVDIAGITGTLTVPESLENIPIALDFSGGDQTIIAPDGTVVKSAIIQKPENLLPENIAEGVDIAGIIGTLVGGGGGGSAKFAFGKIMYSDGQATTIAHNLGATPDFVVFYPWYKATTSGNVLFVGFSTSMGEKLNNFTSDPRLRVACSSSFSISSDRNAGIDDTTGTAFISNANENTFRVPSHAVNWNYQWFAVAGLS